jgi:hypothetical protein
LSRLQNLDDRQKNHKKVTVLRALALLREEEVNAASALLQSGEIGASAGDLFDLLVRDPPSIVAPSLLRQLADSLLSAEVTLQQSALSSLDTLVADAEAAALAQAAKEHEHAEKEQEEADAGAAAAEREEQ